MIEERRKRYEKELHEKYLQLYHNEQCYEELMQMLEGAYQDRSAELRRLDGRREKEPNWYRNRNMLGMTMYPKLFAGGLKGVIEHLDYLSEQKITYLHLMPLLKMPHPYNDGGYAVEDFKQVDSEIGTNEELKRLTKELRKRGISLCLDVVMNHTADTHEWAIRAKRGEQEYMDRYQCYETREIPDQFEKTMPQVFPETAPGNFTWCEEMHRHVLTTFYTYQWDLNYHNPKVFNEMIENILYLANLGVEVFRIDAVPYIWKELGTSCRNLPQVHSIVRMLRIIVEMICPAVILKGEVVMEPKELPVYFGTESEPECHMLYGVSSMVNLWAALATRDTRMLKHQMDVIHSLPKNCYFVNYLRCHDDIGWGLDEEQEKKLEINPIRHKEYLYHFFEGTYPYSFARGELYNYDPATKDARSCGTTASLCGIEKGGFEGDLEQVKQGIQRVLMMHAACMSMEGFVMLSSGDEIGQVNDYDYKKNPDIAELVRGKSGRVIGDVVTLLTMLKGLPLAYNKDMQEDKEAIFDAVDTLRMCLTAFIPMVDTMKVLPENMRNAAARGFINATDRADYLVNKGLAFRDAYKITGTLVAQCIERNLTLETLPLEDYKAVCDTFDEGIYDAISLERCVNGRNVLGAPAPENVEMQAKRVLNLLEK